MCLTCGCNLPMNDHGDKRNITLGDFVQAANAAKITLMQAMINAVKCLTLLLVHAISPELGTEPQTAANDSPSAKLIEENPEAVEGKSMGVLEPTNVLGTAQPAYSDAPTDVDNVKQQSSSDTTTN